MIKGSTLTALLALRQEYGDICYLLGARCKEHYRGYHIYYNQKPGGFPHYDWDYVHDDYDGALDSNDYRCGSACSIEDCKKDIDALER